METLFKSDARDPGVESRPSPKKPLAVLDAAPIERPRRLTPPRATDRRTFVWSLLFLGGICLLCVGLVVGLALLRGGGIKARPAAMDVRDHL